MALSTSAGCSVMGTLLLKVAEAPTSRASYGRIRHCNITAEGSNHTSLFDGEQEASTLYPAKLASCTQYLSTLPLPPITTPNESFSGAFVPGSGSSNPYPSRSARPAVYYPVSTSKPQIHLTRYRTHQKPSPNRASLL